MDTPEEHVIAVSNTVPTVSTSYVELSDERHFGWGIENAGAQPCVPPSLVLNSLQLLVLLSGPSFGLGGVFTDGKQIKESLLSLQPSSLSILMLTVEDGIASSLAPASSSECALFIIPVIPSSLRTAESLVLFSGAVSGLGLRDDTFSSSVPLLSELSMGPCPPRVFSLVLLGILSKKLLSLPKPSLFRRPYAQTSDTSDGLFFVPR